MIKERGMVSLDIGMEAFIKAFIVKVGELVSPYSNGQTAPTTLANGSETNTMAVVLW